MWTVAVLLAALLQDAAALYDSGVEHYNAGDYAGAVELLEKARVLESSVPDYRYHLGLAYMKIGEFKKAASELESTLGMMGMRRETRLKEPMVLVQAGMAYLRMGNVKAARQKVEAALEREASDPDAHFILGLAAREEGDAEAAAKAFSAALEIDRDHPEANIALAEWFETTGELELARENLRHASHGTAENFEILMALGALAFRLQDPDEAIASYEEALETRPDDEDARFNLGTVQLTVADYAGAIETLRALPRHDRGAFNLALAYQSVERYQDARAVLENLLARNAEFDGASFSLALVAEALGDAATAESAYRDAIRKRPEYLPAFLNLAALLERLDRIGEAKSTLQQALELTTDDAERAAIEQALATLEG